MMWLWLQEIRNTDSATAFESEFAGLTPICRGADPTFSPAANVFCHRIPSGCKLAGFSHAHAFMRARTGTTTGESVEKRKMSRRSSIRVGLRHTVGQDFCTVGGKTAAYERPCRD